MKKFVLVVASTFLILILLMPLTLVIGWKPLIEPRLKSFLKTQIQQKLDGQLKIEHIQLQSFFPQIILKFVGLDLNLPKPSTHLLIPSLSLSLDPELGLNPAANLHFLKINVSKPQLRLRLPPSKNGDFDRPKKEGVQQVQPKKRSLAIKLPVRLKTNLEINQGDIAIYKELSDQKKLQFQLQPFSLTFRSPELLGTGQSQLLVSSPLQYEIPTAFMLVKSKVPVSLDIPDLTLGKRLHSNKAKLQLGGLTFEFGTDVDLSTVTGTGGISFTAKNLDELTKTGLLPEAQWIGKASGQVSFELKEAELSSLKTQISIPNLRADFQQPLVQDGARLSGVVELKLQSEATIIPILQTDSFKASLNLTQAFLLKPDLFSKPIGVPLSFSAEGSTDQDKVLFKSFDAQFANVKAQLAGSLNQLPEDTSNLNLTIAKASLSGIHRYLLPLKDYPIKGRIALRANFRGDIYNPMEMSADINPIDISANSGLTYEQKEAKLSLEGPASLSATGRLRMSHQKIEQVDLKLFADLSHLKVKKEGLFEKGNKQTLRLQSHLGAQGAKLIFKDSSLTTWLGSLRWNGWISGLAKTDVDLKTKISDLRLRALHKALKGLPKELPLSGTLDGSLNVKGHFDPGKGFKSSPISLKGSVDYKGQKVVIKRKGNQSSSADNDSSDPESPGANSQSPLAPDWPIIKNSEISARVQLDEFLYNELSVKKINSSLWLNKGNVGGKAKLITPFDGLLEVVSFNLPLLSVPAQIPVKAKLSAMNIGKAMNWAVPDHKNLVSGQLSAKLQGRTVFPSHGNLLQETQFKGQFSATRFILKTLRLEQEINHLIAKIPGKEKTKFKTDSVRGKLSSDFFYAAKKLTYNKLNLITSDGHQLKLQGWANTDLKLEAEGDLLLARLSLEPTLQACLTDKTGRLQVPIKYSGSLVEPRLDFAKKAINRLIGKYGQCRAKAELKKAEGQIKRKAETLLKKETKNIEKEVKKKLEGLFK